MTANANLLVDQFERNRDHLRAVAYRMLGSPAEAEDAVQEAWLRLNRSDADKIENLGGWLTTVVARVSLDMLRARQAHREESLTEKHVEPAATGTRAHDPEREALLADSVGLALLVVLDRLSPAERLAYVLHDLFDIPFEEIASIVGRSPAATRQIASRARCRVQGLGTTHNAEMSRKRSVVDKFLAALRAADIEGLMTLLDPEMVFRSDGFGGVPGAPQEIHGARNWAKGAVAFAAAGRYGQAALIEGEVGLILAPHGRLTRALQFTFVEGRITEARLIANPERLKELEISLLET